MGYKLRDIINKIEEQYPRSLALEWDNPGLMCGHRDKNVETVILALDADNRTAQRARDEHADLILTHHPMIFGSIRNVNDDNALGGRLLALIENGIACYAAHTNFDVARNGMGDIVAKKLGIKSISPLEATAEHDGEPIGIGFIGEYAEPSGIGIKELSEHVKKSFGLNFAWYYDSGKRIHRIAVCPGSGKGMMKDVIASGADVFITGDTGHHDGLEYMDEGISLIDAGHYGLEHIYVDHMYDFMTEHFPEIKVIKELTDERKFV